MAESETSSALSPLQLSATARASRIDDWLPLFLASVRVERGLAHNTSLAYRRDLQHFLDSAGVPPAAVAPVHLREYMSKCLERGLSPLSVARKLTSCREFFKFLVGEELIAADPTRGIPYPKAWKVLPKYLSLAEIDALVKSYGESLLDLRDKAIVLLAFASGLRVSELTALKLNAVDLDRHFVMVRCGKGGKDRIAPLNPPAIAALRDYFDRSRPILLAGEQSEFAFVGRWGQPKLSRVGVWKRLRDRALVVLQKTVSPHQLRHSLATALLRGGAGLREIQAILGHSSIDTVQIYVHTDLASLRAMYREKHPRGRIHETTD